MKRNVSNRRVLAVDPTSKGFGFAVLEGKERLLDWGIKVIPKSDKNVACLIRLTDLIEYYHPQVIVVENVAGKGSRRCLRVQKLMEMIVALAADKKIKTRSFSRYDIRKAFSQYGAVNKHQVALVIARHFPELAPRLPRVRKAWATEQLRMNIFDAVALALTFFGL
jgi:Holliday junction resolvasome RuvABC endonuclease subunit